MTRCSMLRPQAIVRNIAVMSDDVSSTQIKIIELKANPLMKNTSKFIKTETKLTFDAVYYGYEKLYN